MADNAPDTRDALPIEVTRQIDAICDEFEQHLSAGGTLTLVDYLRRVEDPYRPMLLRELSELAVHAARFRQVADPWLAVRQANSQLEEKLLAIQRGASATKTWRPIEQLANAGLRIRCPNCHVQIELVPDADLESVHCSICDSHFALASDDPQNSSGASLERIAHFQLLERVGLGAFGSVWRAHDDDLDRTVALKIPRKGAFDDAQQRAFLREAQAAAQLSHPGIVPVYEVGRDGDVLYIVSEFIRGRTLADTIAAGRVPMHEAAEICRQVADALHHAHKQGVIHRDLKPGNIMLRDDGQPRLMDFGLAKRDSTELTVSLDGAVLGTPAYMPPEQATGDSAKADARSDVYSLGVVLYELLTGELPFRGSVRMLLQQVVNDEAPSPRRLNSSVPQDLETITLKCLQKSPKSRYQSAANLRDELERWLAGKDILSRPTSPAEKTLRWCKRNPAPTAAILASCTTCVLLFATVLYQLQLQRFQTVEAVAGKLSIDESEGLLSVGEENIYIEPSTLEEPPLPPHQNPPDITNAWLPYTRQKESTPHVYTAHYSIENKSIDAAFPHTPEEQEAFSPVAVVSPDELHVYTPYMAYEMWNARPVWSTRLRSPDAGLVSPPPNLTTMQRVAFIRKQLRRAEDSAGKVRAYAISICIDSSRCQIITAGHDGGVAPAMERVALWWRDCLSGKLQRVAEHSRLAGLNAIGWHATSDTLIGASIRSGALHLYKFDSDSGELMNSRHYNAHQLRYSYYTRYYFVESSEERMILLCSSNGAKARQANKTIIDSWSCIAKIEPETLDASLADNAHTK